MGDWGFDVGVFSSQLSVFLRLGFAGCRYLIVCIVSIGNQAIIVLIKDDNLWASSTIYVSMFLLNDEPMSTITQVISQNHIYRETVS